MLQHCARYRKAGELHYDTKLGQTIVSADTDGDGKADFAFIIHSDLVLTAADFVL